LSHDCTLHKHVLRRQNSWVWWYTSVITALRRRRQEDGAFEASPDHIARSFLKSKMKTK
jgi:hypothetical protein